MTETSELKNKKPVVGVLGGVGPMAGVLLHKMIIENTLVKRDQDHLSVLHFSLSSYINDRTKYLLNNKDNKISNPGLGMATVVKSLSIAAKELKTYAICGIPCNTFHSPKIFNIFIDCVNKINNNLNNSNKFGYIKVLNMIELCLNYIKNELKESSVGLMSTTGTRNTCVYTNIANKLNINIIEVNDLTQQLLHNNIYNINDGIKVLSKASPRVRSDFESFVKQLKNKGVKSIILGCTEIPIALPEKELFGIKLIDPMQILAKQLVTLAT